MFNFRFRKTPQVLAKLNNNFKSVNNSTSNNFENENVQIPFKVRKKMKESDDSMERVTITINNPNSLYL